MVSCPNCRKKVPAWKLFFLTNYNAIKCPSCSAKLQVENRKTSRLIGGVGGGVGGGLGALLGVSYALTGEVTYIVLLIALIFVVALGAWMTSVKFIRLEVKTTSS